MQKHTCKNKSFMTKRKAFTLIELLIVIAIIGILFIVLISKVDFATDKAKTTGVQTDFRSFQVAIETVAKENAGLSTFGWDTGDTNGDRVRNSYDKGDTNKNGVQDDGEVFVGSKIYGEIWTNVYTLTNPADTSDMSAIAALEAAINANLDPKLHITIHDDYTITMANGAQDPWNTEYHGYYITNATVDKKDNGAIVIYSNGANQEFGSEHSISNGVVVVNVPGNNVYGKDDYSLASVYTYANGYGEIKTTTTGFSQNQGGGQAGTNGTFFPGNNDEPDTPDTPNLPEEDPTKTLNDYTWEEIKQLADANLTPEEYKNNYGIELGQKKEDKYVLVDFDGNAYDGFVFMYQSNSYSSMYGNYSNTGGYAQSQIVSDKFDMIGTEYNKFSDELKAVLKEVTIKCTSGSEAPGVVYDYVATIFVPSVREVGGTVEGVEYDQEGQIFDYFVNADNRMTLVPRYYGFFTRSTKTNSTYWYYVTLSNSISSQSGQATGLLVPTFVVGSASESNGSSNTGETCQHTNTEYVYISDGNGRTHSMDLKCLDCTYYETDVNGEFCGALICDLCGSYCNHSFTDTIVENRCVFCGTMKFYDEPVLDNYTWAEIKAIAQKNLNSHDLLDQYGIALGNTKTENGVTYKLVDLDGNAYDGFVFIYDTGVSMSIQPMTNITTDGGYAESDFADNVNALYNDFSNELKNAIKDVTIKCSNNETYGWLLFDYTAKVFVPSLRESGSNIRAGDTTANEAFENEGQFFDYFNDSMTSMQYTSQRAKIYSGGKWWLRSVDHMFDSVYHAVSANGSNGSDNVTSSNRVVACFVIG